MLAWIKLLMLALTWAGVVYGFANGTF